MGGSNVRGRANVQRPAARLPHVGWRACIAIKTPRPRRISLGDGAATARPRVLSHGQTDRRTPGVDVDAAVERSVPLGASSQNSLHGVKWRRSLRDRSRHQQQHYPMSSTLLRAAIMKVRTISILSPIYRTSYDANCSVTVRRWPQLPSGD